MNKEIASLISQIARIRNVDTTYVCETLKQSVLAGLKRRFGPDVRAEVEIDPEVGEMRVFVIRTAVAEVKNEVQEIALAEAKQHKADVAPGEDVKIPVPPGDIGRIAIRKTSEELVLRLREAERTKLFDEYTKKRGEIVTGTIQKIARDEIIINLGLVEASLPLQEQLKTDHYRQGAPIKALVFRVEKTAMGPRILLSRTHPDFLRRLLAKEIPEIRQNAVEIKAVARAPSFRSKVAVFSADERIDPVGACVGYRKSRIDNVIKELSGEKIDIVQWSKDPLVFIARALGPAKVKQVVQEDDTFIVVVPDAEFSIAIGKKGQNVWLASLLVGAKIEVLKETDFRNRAIMNRATRVSLVDLGLGEELTTRFQDAQILTAFDLLSIEVSELAEATGLEPGMISDIKRKVDAQLKLSEKEEQERDDAVSKDRTEGEEQAAPEPTSVVKLQSDSGLAEAAASSPQVQARPAEEGASSETKDPKPEAAPVVPDSALPPESVAADDAVTESGPGVQSEDSDSEQ